VLSRKHGQAVVMMRSLAKVTRYFGVTNLGGCGEVLLSELKNLRYHATDLQVQFSQFCGIFGATEGKGNVEELQRELIDPIFQRSQSRTWGAVKPVKGVTWVGPRCLFVKPDFALGGISQKKIGEALDRDKRTVSRRLSDSVRERRGLITVDRRQVARQDLETSKAILNQTPAQLMMQGQTDAAMERPKFFGCSGRLWKAEANLYSVPVVLVGRRHWRREVKRAGITPEVPTKKG
jgi:hypothetical protein